MDKKEIKKRFGDNFGLLVSQSLVAIEDSIWQWEVDVAEKPDYSDDGFRAATKIFMSAIMDKMYTLQSKEDIPMEDRMKMANKCGEELRELVKKFTDIDTQQLYK